MWSPPSNLDVYSFSGPSLDVYSFSVVLHPLFPQAEQECDNLRRKLKLVEDDLDRAEERLSELSKQSSEFEGALEDRERWVLSYAPAV